MIDPLLCIEDLSVALPTKRGPRKAVDSVSLDIAQGEIVGVAGESGSGKTMTALTLLGLLPHGATTSGSVRFDSRELLHCKPKQMRELRGREIAMISQDPATSLHPILRIETQLTEHMRHHLGVSKSEARTRAVDLLNTVRIPDPEQALRAYPGEFSGGMRQRIAIAAALACEPKLVLADEPTTALDVTVQAGILALLDRLRGEQRLAVMVITHDLGVMSAIADRVYVMYAGRLAESGPRSEVLGRPRHPYTRGLLDALPHPDSGTTQMRSIAGTPPALGTVPNGCAFHPRCAHAVIDCATVRPDLVTVAPGHDLACPVDPFGAPDD